jgi:hypothetical protein
MWLTSIWRFTTSNTPQELHFSKCATRVFQRGANDPRNVSNGTATAQRKSIDHSAVHLRFSGLFGIISAPGG